jgi:D-psicose/D-tagatose/L-ribulose 3-epimerase
MNKLGVHALVRVGGWSHKEAARPIGQTAELGYDPIEVPALDPSSIDVDFTRRELEKAGIGVTLSLGLGGHADISNGDEGKVVRGEAVLMDALAVGHDLCRHAREFTLAQIKAATEAQSHSADLGT